MCYTYTWSILFYYCIFSCFLYFFKFPSPSQNLEFHTYRSYRQIGLSEVIKFYIYKKMIKKAHFMSPCKLSWWCPKKQNLAYAIPPEPHPQKYLTFQSISPPILSQCFFLKAPTIFKIFFNIHLDSPISHISKHFWNILSSYNRHLYSAPNVYPQVWGTIQRHVTKMARRCFSGFDVAMLFLCFGIHPK